MWAKTAQGHFSLKEPIFLGFQNGLERKKDKKNPSEITLAAKLHDWAALLEQRASSAGHMPVSGGYRLWVRWGRIVPWEEPAGGEEARGVDPAALVHPRSCFLF